jgi:hypothetical protein
MAALSLNPAGRRWHLEAGSYRGARLVLVAATFGPFVLLCLLGGTKAWAAISPTNTSLPEYRAASTASTTR